MVLLGAFPVLPIKLKCHLRTPLCTLSDFPVSWLPYYWPLQVISRGFLRTEWLRRGVLLWLASLPRTLPPKPSATRHRVKIYVN